MPLTALLRKYDHVLLDLDGCVWVGDEPTPRAAEAVTALREGGKHIAYITNDSRHTGEEFVQKLWGMGFQASLEEVVTVGGAIQHLLAGRGGGSALVVGSQALVDHVADAGMRIVNGTEFATRADVVVVAAHDLVTYAELRTAVQAVMRGAELIGAGRDPVFPMPDGPWPASGAIVAAVEHASGGSALTVGKPEPHLFVTALDRLGPGEALVVGDRPDSDLAGARAAGLDGALVLTGSGTREQAEAMGDPPPVAIADSLADLVLRP